MAARDSFSSPGKVRDWLRLKLATRQNEVFMALWLDAQNRLIKADELFTGTLTQTSVYPREVVKAALANNAAAVILAHNHPSGVAEPSSADELLTRNLKAGAGPGRRQGPRSLHRRRHSHPALLCRTRTFVEKTKIT